MPGHVNAALASYAELNCDGKAPPLYTGTGVGFSSLCVTKEITYRFVDDVIGELAALTPGPYLHIGGDEAYATKPADYVTFMNRVQAMVAAHGKTALAWHQVVEATPPPSTVAQYWGTTRSAPDVAAAAGRGTKLVLSPANKAYLDMKYDASTPLGQTWAGLIEVKDAYDWDPGAYLDGVGPLDRVDLRQQHHEAAEPVEQRSGPQVPVGAGQAARVRPVPVPQRRSPSVRVVNS